MILIIHFYAKVDEYFSDNVRMLCLGGYTTDLSMASLLDIQQNSVSVAAMYPFFCEIWNANEYVGNCCRHRIFHKIECNNTFYKTFLNVRDNLQEM